MLVSSVLQCTSPFILLVFLSMCPFSCMSVFLSACLSLHLSVHFSIVTLGHRGVECFSERDCVSFATGGLKVKHLQDSEFNVFYLAL